MKYSIKQKNIPSEWQKERLGDVAFFKNGKGHEQNIVSNGEYIVVNSKFVASGGKVFKKSDKKLSPLYIGEVVMVMSDVPKGKAIAKCFLINKNNSYTLNQRICAISSDKLNSLFLLYLLNRNRYFLSFDDGVNQTNLRRDDVLSCPLIFPPLLEQNKIVKILETWDKYLEKLEKKIEVKENIKRGLMQKLLCGDVRLKGFSDKWKELYLKQVGDVRTSSVDKKTVNGEIVTNLLNYMDVYKRDHVSSSDKFQKVTAKQQQIISSNLKKGDILFTPSSETQDDIGHSAVVVEDLKNVVFSYHLMRFRPKKNIFSYRFSAYCFKSYKFYLELWKKSQGATRFTLSKGALEKSKIIIPFNTEEQIALAKIFETMDENINSLENKKKIIVNQKRYLLNNLITGKIRIPEFQK